jgi:hypothetical protein
VSILDISSAPPTAEQNYQLALSVVRLAFADLNSPDPDLREDARFFFEESLWWPDVPWAQVLQLERDRFMPGLRRKLKADYLLPVPA